VRRAVNRRGVCEAGDVLPTLLARTKAAIARHPVAAFLTIGIGVYVVFGLISPLVETQILPFSLPLFGVLGGPSA
jgi:hypothetical protein